MDNRQKQYKKFVEITIKHFIDNDVKEAIINNKSLFNDEYQVKILDFLYKTASEITLTKKKNEVPSDQRCIANKINGTQCTKRRINNKKLCGIHDKKISDNSHQYGTIEDNNNDNDNNKKSKSNKKKLSKDNNSNNDNSNNDNSNNDNSNNDNSDNDNSDNESDEIQLKPSSNKKNKNKLSKDNESDEIQLKPTSNNDKSDNDKSDNDKSDNDKSDNDSDSSESSDSSDSDVN